LPEGNTGQDPAEITNENLERFLGPAFGSLFHLALARVTLKRGKNPDYDFPKVTKVLYPGTNGMGEVEKAMQEPLDRSRYGVSGAILMLKARLKGVANYRKPYFFKRLNDDETLKQVEAEWEKAVDVGSVTLGVLAENHELLNNPERFAVLPEVGVWPRTKNIETIIAWFRRMDRDQNPMTAMGFSKEEMLGYLTEVWKWKRNPFDGGENCLIEGELSNGESQSLFLKTLQRAQMERALFMGGRALISSLTDLEALLGAYPNGGGWNGETFSAEALMAELPDQPINIRSPMGGVVDMLVLEMPDESDSEQAEALHEIRQYALWCYKKLNSKPALFQDFKFMSMVDEAVRKWGMKIRIGEVKTSMNGMPEGVQTAHGRELAIYTLILAQAVESFRFRQNPDKKYGIFELLADPLVQALDETFVWYLGINRDGNGDLYPQFEERRAFSGYKRKGNGNKIELFRRYRILVKQLNDLMLVGRARKNLKRSGKKA